MLGIWSSSHLLCSRGVRASVLALLFASGLLLAGCKEESSSLDDMEERSRTEMAPILEKHRAAANAKFEAIRAAAKDAPTVPPITQREPATTRILARDGGAMQMEAGGLLLANAEWAVLAKSETPKVSYSPALPTGVLFKALKDGHIYDTGHGAGGVDQQFGVLTGLKQLALIRVQTYLPPKATLTASGERRFQAGRAIGDVLIYDLETGQRIGGYPFEAGQGDSAYITKTSEQEIQRELESSFGISFELAMRSELVAYAAGKLGPATPGAAARESLRRFGDKIKLDVAMEYLLSGPKEVEFSTDGDDELVVTIKAETPSSLTHRNGTTIAGVEKIVEKVLGRKATVKVVKAE